MLEIKTISCHGTSYTEGGGFEWDIKSKSKELEKYYKDLPKTQFNYSWPGQLQNLVNAKVSNFGKSGYGNEKVYRDVHSIFLNENVENTSHLFLIEISQIGRTELFINDLDDYCVINYDWDDDNKYKYQGSANEYFRDSSTTQGILGGKKTFFEEYIKTTKNLKNNLETIERNFDYLISFLEHNNLNYCFVNTPIILFNKKPSNSKIITYPSNNKKRILTDFVDYIEENKLSISDDTNGKINDPHFGFLGNKSIADIIHKKLTKTYIL